MTKKLFALLFLAAALLTSANRVVNHAAPPAGITQDALSSYYGYPSGDLQNWAHAQGSLTNGYVLAVVTSGGAVSSVSYGPTGSEAAMTLLKTQGGGINTFIYGLALGTSAAGSKNVKLNQLGGPCLVEIITYSGVNQSATFTVAGAYGASATPSVGITATATSELVVAGMCSWASTGGVTEGKTLYVENQSDAHWAYSIEHTPGASGTVTMNWTIPDADGNFSAAAVVLTPAP